MPALKQHVQTVRSFNRFYTRRIGVLGHGHLNSPFSLTEVRVLYEMAHRERPVAADLSRDLGLDAGYLSRILLRFQKLGLVKRTRSEHDARESQLALTAKGLATFGPLDSAASEEVAKMLKQLAPSERERVATAMGTIANRLDGWEEPDPPYLLRPHRAGDIGWVIHRHGVLYAQEYGWRAPFEALVAEIGARFLREFDPKREHCWIAERRGEIVGSVLLIRETDRIARLRLLLVEPAARGLGLGKHLVDECVRFARRAGYRKITLWTRSVLNVARRIYQNAGFRLTHEETHTEFGLEQTEQTWDLDL
jgi:DNA-binding MarR family transcriptional regulator/N-acetylglutamate synthase-like GNAT family acetyltransferase